MKFKEWKAGDEAFLVNLGWIVLEPLDNPLYPLQFRDYSFTKEGRQWTDDRYPSLLDHNPFDPSDPKNPPAHGTEWPFLLRGRRLEIGMEILVQGESGIVPARVQSLLLTRAGVSAGVRYSDGRSSEVWSPVILFPDEVPSKKESGEVGVPYHRDTRSEYGGIHGRNDGGGSDKDVRNKCADDPRHGKGGRGMNCPHCALAWMVKVASSPSVVCQRYYHICLKCGCRV